MPRLLAILLLVALSLPACEATRHAAAKREDTVEAYRRFLAQFPKSKRGDGVRMRLEALEFKRARSADRPIAYRMYLERYPSGRYARQCKARLARLSLDRARSVADLRLVMEKYEDTPEAAEARRRLPALLAAQVLASGDPAALRDFIQAYPGMKQTARVKRALARMRHGALGDDRHALEAFARELAGTPEAEQARQRARGLLEQEVALTGSTTLLRELRSRYPRSARIPELRRLVARRQARLAVLALDMGALERTGVASIGKVKVQRVLAHCKRRPERCRQVKEAARAAGPWRPTGGAPALRAAVHGQDIIAAWRTIEALGWSPDIAAADLLVELLGSARPSTARLAGRGLARWLGRATGKARGPGWLAGHLRRPPRRGNDDEAQRHGVLLLLAGKEVQGRAALEALAARPGRALTGALLLVQFDLARGRKPPTALTAQLAAAAGARLKSLRDAFPAELNAESGVAALLAERELFVLERVLARLVDAGGAGDAVTRAHATAADALARWRVDLERDVKAFRPAADPDLTAEVTRHERGRAAALRRLRAGRDPAGRAAAAAIQALYPVPASPK